MHLLTHLRGARTLAAAGTAVALLAASSALALPASAGTDTSTPATVTGHFGGGSDANKPSYWCPSGSVGLKLPDDYGYSAVGTMLDDGHRFVLGLDANPGAPGNQPYVKVVVKAGAEASVGDSVNTEFAQPPVAGQFVWADTNPNGEYDKDDKQISHIIICAGPTPPPAKGSIKAVKEWSYSPADVKDLVTEAPTPGTLTFTAGQDVRTPDWGAPEKYNEGTKVRVTEDLAKAKPPVVPGYECVVTGGEEWPSFSVDGGQASPTAPTVTVKGDTTVSVTVTNRATCTKIVVPPTTSLQVTKEWAYGDRVPPGYELTAADAGALQVYVGGTPTGQAWDEVKKGLAIEASATVTEGTVPDPKDPKDYRCTIQGSPQYSVNGGDWADTATFYLGADPNTVVVRNTVDCTRIVVRPTTSLQVTKEWTYGAGVPKGYELTAADAGPLQVSVGGTPTGQTWDEVKKGLPIEASTTVTEGTVPDPKDPEGYTCTIQGSPQYKVNGGDWTATATFFLGADPNTVLVRNTVDCTTKVVPPPPTTSLTVSKEWAYVGAPQGYQLNQNDAGALAVTVGGQATGQTWNQAKQGLPVGASAAVTEGPVPDPRDPQGYTCTVTGSPQYSVNSASFASAAPQFALLATPNTVVVRNTVTCVAVTEDGGQVGDVEDVQDGDDTGDQAVDSAEDELAHTGADFGPAGVGALLVLTGAALIAARRRAAA